MDETESFDRYDIHYSRMLNTIPDWEFADRNQDSFRCRKPWLPANSDARILDFGCGWGHQLLSLWCAGYRNVEGVELVPEQAIVANGAARGRIKVVCIDGRDYVAESKGQYDLIILNDVLEHIPVSDASDLLRQIWTALVPAGTIVVRVPNAGSICAAYSRYLDVTHVTGFTEYSLMQLLDQTGFENHKIVPDDIGIKWHTWRPWKPWRGLAIRPKLNHCLHRIVYWLRGQAPVPTVFGMNLEIYSHKPAGLSEVGVRTLGSPGNGLKKRL
ncbi:MAG: class I SAM-dependent methyltransferase [Desulfomonilaceae bacterium]